MLPRRQRAVGLEAQLTVDDRFGQHCYRHAHGERSRQPRCPGHNKMGHNSDQTEPGTLSNDELAELVQSANGAFDSVKRVLLPTLVASRSWKRGREPDDPRSLDVVDRVRRR
jgi:hypothetical protein